MAGVLVRGRVWNDRAGAVLAPQGQDLLGHRLADVDSLLRPAQRDTGQIRSQFRIEDSLLLRVENDRGVVRRLGRRCILRGAARGLHVREVGGVRPVDGVDGVIDRDTFQRQVTEDRDPRWRRFLRGLQ